MENKKSDFVAVGKIVSPHGIKGEVRLILFARDAKSFEKFDLVFVGKDFISAKKMKIEKIKAVSDKTVVKFSEIESREEVSNYLNHFIFIPEDKKLKLGKNKFFIDDLIGIEVFDLNLKKNIGVLLNIEKYPAQDVYSIKTSSGIVMLPAVKEFINKIDLNEKKIFITPPEGIYEN